MKRVTAVVLVIILVLSLTSCRSRISNLPAQKTQKEMESDNNELSNRLDGKQEIDNETEENKEQQSEYSENTVENPDASKKEYHDDSDAEISSDADTTITKPGGKKPAGNGPVADDDGDRNASETVNGNDDKTSADDDGEKADTVMMYYKTLLADCDNGLFECQRMQIYWEGVDDYVTVNKASGEQAIITQASAYNVASKRDSNGLEVTSDWVQRKNPDVIVKVVDKTVLGAGVSNTGKAENIKNSIMGRDGWDAVGAVKKNRIILISEELLQGSAGQTAASLFVAMTIYPSHFTNTDFDEALRELTKETGNQIKEGVYVFT